MSYYLVLILTIWLTISLIASLCVSCSCLFLFSSTLFTIVFTILFCAGQWVNLTCKWAAGWILELWARFCPLLSPRPSLGFCWRAGQFDAHYFGMHYWTQSSAQIIMFSILNLTEPCPLSVGIYSLTCGWSSGAKARVLNLSTFGGCREKLLYP